MTVIAWDGTTLAADKRATANGVVRTTTKISRIKGHLVAFSGDLDVGMALLNWYKDGCVPEKWPQAQKTDRWTSLLVITPEGKITKYETEPYPLLFEDKQFAMGSGRDFALAAMYLGKSAREAVKITNALSVECGNGIDWLRL